MKYVGMILSLVMLFIGGRVVAQFVLPTTHSGTQPPFGTPPPLLCPAGQTCYFVSSSSGSDANNGLSSTAPFATIGKAMTILNVLGPDDQLLFKAGDLWTGDGSLSGCASNCNPTLYLGDTAGHTPAGTAGHPVVISSYGTGAQPIIDGANLNGFCFAADGPGTNVSNLTINNFECRHAFAAGIYFKTSNGAFFQHITVSNNYVHNVNAGCATVTNGSCVGKDGWSGWAATNHQALNDYIEPTINNTNKSIFRAQGACTTGSSQPNWNSSSTVGTTLTDGTGGTICTWYNTGVRGVYKNNINGEDDSGGSHAYRFIGNTVRWNGGHNQMQIHGDFGGCLLDSNILGPGNVHGAIDLKGAGSSGAHCVVSNNFASCGYSLTECGCQHESLSSQNCQTGTGSMTPALFTLAPFSGTSYIDFISNTVYDDGAGIQIMPGSIAGGCPSATACPIKSLIYNNTVYTASGHSNMYAFYSGNNASGGSLDMRNNIFDGGTNKTVEGNTGWATVTEGFNNIGGIQGNAGFTLNGNGPAASDKIAVDPKYVSASTFDFRFKIGSTMLNAGDPSLIATTGNKNIGDYAGTGE